MPRKNTGDRPAVLFCLKEEGRRRRQRETSLVRRAKRMAIQINQQFRFPNRRAPHAVPQRPRTPRMVEETNTLDGDSTNSPERSVTPIDLDQDWETWDRPMTPGKDLEEEAKSQESPNETKKPDWTPEQLADYVQSTPDPTKWETEISEALSKLRPPQCPYRHYPYRLTTTDWTRIRVLLPPRKVSNTK